MFGWLTPNRKFVECGLNKHFKALQDIPEFADTVTIIQIYLDDIRLECEARIDEGDHPEWHCYDMAMGDAVGKTYAALLDQGLIRIGRKGDRVHFEGRPQTLADRRQECIDFAEGYGCTAEFEPQIYGAGTII